MKKFSLLLTTLLLLASVLAVAAGGCTGGIDTAGETRVVTDIAERTVTIPANPQAIATMPGPTYEMVFCLGGADQIGLVRDDHQSNYPVANLTNPDLVDYKIIADVGPQTPVNTEEFLSLGPDMVIYYNIPAELEKFEAAGIPCIVVNWSTITPACLKDVIDDQKHQLSFLADVLGGDCVKQYQEWAKYTDETVAFLTERTTTLSEADRPVVYVGNSWGTNILSTWSIQSNQYIYEMCGGKLVGVMGPGKFPEINKEQLLAWEPEVIIVDNHGRDPESIIADLKTNADWASLPAVKSGRIHRIPSGVFFLDKGSSSTVYYYWLAKQLQPELFADVDVVKEIKYYFKTFYGYELTTAEAENVIAGWVVS